MEDFPHHRKRRRHPMDGRRKLLKNQLVEVKSIEDGFQGSWHDGKIIECRSGVRKVRYEHLLDDDESEFLTESVEVSSAVEGFNSSSVTSDDCPCRIRPRPTNVELTRENACYSLCVDTYFNDAWWEGVIFDRADGSDERLVFHPDLGDELVVNLKDLRMSYDWDEVTTEWIPRGNWQFLEIVEEHERENLIPVSLKQIWYDVRERREFCQIGHWASVNPLLWKKLILEVIDGHMEVTVDKLARSCNLSQPLLENSEPVSAAVEQGMAVIDKGVENDPLDVDSEGVTPSSRIDAPFNDQVVPVQPKALSVICSERPIVDGFAQFSEACSSQSRFSRSCGFAQFSASNGSGAPYSVSEVPSSVSEQKTGKESETGNSPGRRCKLNWQPERGKLNLKAELCPESISEYLRTPRPPKTLSAKVRNHLFYCGWKMDYVKFRSQSRVRFVSPDGCKVYNMRAACEYFEKSVAEKSDLTVEDGEIRMLSSCDNLDSPPQLQEPRLDCEQIEKKKGRGAPTVPEPEYVHVEPTYAPEAETRMLSLCENLDSPPLLQESRMSCEQTVKGKGRKADTVPEIEYFHVKPKYSPEAVFSYLNSLRGNKHVDRGLYCKLVGKARKHLSAINWKFWYKQKKGKPNLEWRYNSPTTGAVYYSLRSACRAIAGGVELNTSTAFSSTPTENVRCSEEPMGHSVGEPSSSDTEPQTTSRKCRLRIKHRAGRIGKLHKRKKSLVPSPSSLSQNKRQDQLVEESGSKNGTKRCSVKIFLSKKREAVGKVRSSSKKSNSARVLRSSKRVRQEAPSSFPQAPRSVLSWLIDNDVVRARTKVSYRRKSDVKPAAEGRVTRDGIRCNCCGTVFSLSGFEAHAGSGCRRPSANIYLEDGRSLAECQMEMMHKKGWGSSREPLVKAEQNKSQSWNDHICSICRYGGELILCDQCPSSFHKDCLNLQSIPEGDWFCPSCCCGICGGSQFDVDTEQFTDKSVLCCLQCERQFHAHCIRDREMVNLDARPEGNWFCSKMCEKIHWGLQQLLGKSILVGHNNLTWTLIKPMDYEASDCDAVTMAENYSKLNVALEVMHECFEPVKEPQTGRDLVEDVVFCRGSHLHRLNFRGFYTVLLERNDELITVAILRVYGNKVAEIPLVGTRFQHRRLGMCRILMNELEKNLMELGVDRLVLPAAASVLNTWTTSFGFSAVTPLERSEFLGYTFLDFQDTVMCQKLLKKISSEMHSFREAPAINCEPRPNIEGSNNILDVEGNSGISEVFQVEQREGSECVDQGAQPNDIEDKSISDNKVLDRQDSPVLMATESTNQESESCKTVELTDQKKVERDKFDGNLKFYTRKKAVELRPSIPQTDYSKVEVSCR